jgi:hypothetical protein
MVAGGPDGAGAAGAGDAAQEPGLYQDFCCTLTQMRVLAAAAFDQSNVAAAAANQSDFMVGSLFASPVVQSVCQRDARAAIARGRVPRSTRRWKSRHRGVRSRTKSAGAARWPGVVR